MSAPKLEQMCPFFVVSDVEKTITFYRDKLGFAVWHQQPEGAPFFAIVGRDNAMLFLKSGEAAPVPNSQLDPEMRWDSYIRVQEVDALAAEYVDRGTVFSSPLMDAHDGLHGFEITDPDGYVLFFGRPRV